MKRRRTPTAAGFTLVEAVITVAILALAMGVVLVNWGASAADLRATTARLAGTVRAAYDGAALNGQTYRLAFSFEKGIVQVEATEQALAFADGENPIVRGARNVGGPSGFEMAMSAFMSGNMDGLDDMDGDGEEDAFDEPPPAVEALMGLADPDREKAAASFSGTGHDLRLEEGIKLLDVWVQGMNEPATEGDVYLYFFAHGYTQDAFIHLEDEEGRVFTLQVHSLTGKTEIFNEYKESPK